MLILDDLLTFPLAFANIQLTPNLFIMIFESFDNFARDKLIEEISDRIKENRMLFELKELGEEEYSRINEQLIEKLNLAKKAVSSEYEARVRMVS